MSLPTPLSCHGLSTPRAKPPIPPPLTNPYIHPPTHLTLSQLHHRPPLHAHTPRPKINLSLAASDTLPALLSLPPGLQNIHHLTLKNRYELRVDLEDFENNTVSAKYSEFALSPNAISAEEDGYSLHVAGFTDGGAGEGTQASGLQAFSLLSPCSQRAQGSGLPVPSAPPHPSHPWSGVRAAVVEGVGSKRHRYRAAAGQERGALLAPHC